MPFSKEFRAWLDSRIPHQIYASHLHLTKFLLFRYTSFYKSVQRYANKWWGILKSLPVERSIYSFEK